MKNLIYLIAVLISGLCTNISEAQSLSVPADGKDFYLGFILPSYNSVADAQVSGYYGAYLLISSYEDNKASVSYFDKTTGIETPGTVYSMAERTGIQVPLNLQYTLMDSVGDAPEFGAIHIKSKRPINVEFFSTGACSGGSYLGLSTAALGTKYVVASYNDNPGTGALFGLAYGPTSIEHSHGCFEIVAAFDSTRVTITPNATTMKGHIGVNSGANSTGIPVPYTVTLRRGQCYFVKSGSSDNTVDISGSIIESSKPVAVLGAHENAFLGSVNGKTLEGRDFMVEQMVPVDNWDTTGYVSIPMKDSQPQDVNLYPGYGENYRVYSYDDAVTHAECFQAGVANPAAMLSAKYQHPTPELPDIINPVEFRSTDGRKFSVMLYDDRNVAMQNPYPAPSMMTIVPMSHWRTSFLWYVPANKFEQMQDYFVNILAPIADLNNSSGVMASFNGGTIKPIKQVMTLDAQWTNIPNHPELVGARFKIYPGSYYATGPHPFMVYNYGFRGLDPNNDIGDFEGDDFFFSYAAPSGMTMGTGSAHIRVSIDRYCSSWNVCLHDSTFGLAGQGIKMIMLLDDARGDYFKPGKQYFNTRLDDVLDPNHTGEIDLDGNDSNICFTVNINRPFDSAYAPLFISDALGNATTIDLVYSPPNVSLSPDSGSYLELPLSTDSCMKYVFKNNGKPGSGAFNLQTADLVLKSPSFRVVGTVPPLPALVAPGDSLVLTVCFSPRDTMTVRDTVHLTNACFASPIPLVGSGVIPQILASDHDFGFVLVDSTKCDTVGVRNVGKAPLVLMPEWILDNLTEFKFMDKALLPVTLNPGQIIYLTFCYTPHSTSGDSGFMFWATNEKQPYIRSIKDSSLLRGRGVRTGFIWDRTTQSFVGDSLITDDSVITRVHLLNFALKGSSFIPAHVDSIFIQGSDADEFYILATQFGRAKNFDLKPGDTIWVDIVFKPDVTKPYPRRYADRHAELVARNQSSEPIQNDQTVNLIGTWEKSSVAPASTLNELTIHPNPVSGNTITVSLSKVQDAAGSLSIFDVLGREVYKMNVIAGVSEFEVPVRELATGLYYIRIASGSKILTRKFEISR